MTDPESPAAPLRLRAQSRDDLVVISALLQNALLWRRDLHYDHDAWQVVAIFNRFRHEDAASSPPYWRTHTVLRLDAVTRVRRTTALPALGRVMVQEVLTLTADPGDDAPQTLTLTCAGGAIAFEILALDLLLHDLGAPWTTPWRPTSA